ncbi:inactive peptidyl-prolyl cis-trans isomerase FKBP6-like [Chiloscyllium plagiosum]|uniref:inactive peptidyl-prolyl cis-trans isomerase FKBP6-like n=1 Tax=Chiloscyllium plagiosum TaxID=36176 RepID=UPI001CB868C8|nr:inactive peptidyl-prolyl cis-trans isomerase FKBP6-like [Chiloscyllium plagiosum]
MNGPPPSSRGQLSPFYHMSQRMQDVTGDGGVLKEILRPGSGSVIPPTASVSVHYSAYSEYTDKPFDSNLQKEVPRFMKLGRDITLLGMELAIQTMRKGEFARFLFKPQYAYGQMGCPPRIPANATVMFELEILHVVDTLESDEYFMLSQFQARLQSSAKCSGFPELPNDATAPGNASSDVTATLPPLPSVRVLGTVTARSSPSRLRCHQESGPLSLGDQAPGLLLLLPRILMKKKGGRGGKKEKYIEKTMPPAWSAQAPVSADTTYHQHLGKGSSV